MPTGRFVGTDRQLFLDRGLLGEADEIDVVVHPLQNTAEPVLVPDQPWETAADAFIGHVGSIMREEDGRFRLWYDYIYGTQHVEQPGDKGRCMAYAESADGVHFEKPLFAWHPMRGSSRTNILIPASRGGSVWIDPNAPPERRYRHQGKQALVIPGVRRVEFHASPDGLRWQPTHAAELGDCDTQNLAFWDELAQRYVLYTRKWVRDPDPAGPRYRQVRRLESDDLVRWDSERIVWEVDGLDLACHQAPDGHPGVDSYGATAYRYPGAGDFYVLFATAFWHWFRRPEGGAVGVSGDPEDRRTAVEQLSPQTFDVRLGYSRDGVRFSRPADRRAFLRPGRSGRFDSRMVWVLPFPVVVGDELWVYYHGLNRSHDHRVDPAAGAVRSGIGRAVMRLDGFASAHAVRVPGTLVTEPLRFAGEGDRRERRLELNVDTGGGGWARVALLDSEARSIPGFGLEDAAVVSGNGIDVPVQWRGNPALASLAGRPVRLLVQLFDADLYAFRFGEGRRM